MLTILDVFDQHARQSPDRVFLRSGDETISYAEAAARSRRLATALASAGVGRGDLVALLLPQSCDLIIAMLAAFRVGAGYVPLDPAYPAERLAAMAEDASPAAVVTDAARAGLARELSTAPHLLLDTVLDPVLDPALHLGLAAGVPATDAAVPASESAARPGDVAYCLFTSGSTGRPKGVLIEHSSLLTYAQAVVEAWNLGPEDRVLQFSTPSFDVSVEEIFAAVAAGATLVIKDPEVPTFAEYAALLRTHAITATSLPTAYWRGLVPGGVAAELAASPLRALTIGGESSNATDAVAWERATGIDLFNSYGPTETTVSATYGDPAIVRALAELPPEAPELAGYFPIGAEFAGNVLLLVDEEGAPVEDGTEGELWIGGPGVARGYLNAPEQTAERFVTATYAGTEHRFYRSGDRMMRGPDGQLHFLGRTDDQVKISGFRVEPGEIEAALAALPEVTEAVVVARAGPTPVLIGFVTLSADARRQDGALGHDDVLGAVLRDRLAASLPPHLVPAVVTVIDAMPVTPTGKTDRAALQMPTLSASLVGGAPRTPQEELVAREMAEVLGLPELGRDEDFFTVGGQSLLATVLIARLQRRTGAVLSLRDLFAARTPAALAVTVAAAPTASAEDVPLPPRPDVDVPFELSTAQQRFWLAKQLDRSSAAYGITEAWEIDGQFDPHAFAAALSTVVHRHEALRMTVVDTPDGARGVVSAAVAVPFEEIDLRSEAAPERAAQAAAALLAATEFPADVAPRLRAASYRTGETRRLVVVSMDHLAVDGWSAAVLVAELRTAYAAVLNATDAAQLTDLGPSYLAAAARRDARITDEARTAALAHWTRSLEGAEYAELPTDRPRPSDGVRLAGRTELHLTSADLDALLDAARGAGATLFAALTSGLQVLLARHTGSSDITIGTALAGRSDAETAYVVGPLVNTVALREQIAGDATFADLLTRSHDAMLDAHTHQDVPFEDVVAAVATQRDRSRNALFQVMFVLQNNAATEFAAPGATVTPVRGPAPVPQFDLALDALPAADGLTLVAEYDAALFEEVSVDRLLRHYRRLLLAAAAAPTAPVLGLPMAEDSERAELLELGTTPVPAGSPRTDVASVLDLLDRACAAHPDSPALIQGSRTVTYGQLHRLVARTARSLHGAGALRDRLVAVLADRSPEQIAAFFAIWRAGAGYLSLDPANPADRLAFQMHDAESVLLLTDDANADLARKIAGDTTVVLPLTELAAVTGPALEPARPGGADLAYAIYTSGSTGVPKGVLVEHRNALNLVCDVAERLSLTPADRVLQFSSASFDASIDEIYPVLTVGGTLVLRGTETPDFDELRTLIEQHEVTTVQLPTAYWRAWVRDDALDWLRGSRVRGLVIGGEAAGLADARQWAERTGVALHNSYGPTETTVDATFADPAEIATATPASEILPIGRAITGTSVYVVDAGLALAPRGGVGELAVAGAGVARGYHKRPDLTAERYVADPFDTTSGNAPGRMYLTGDLVRWSNAGSLEYLGRRDAQVKIRGHRIELGEIEAVLAGMPGLSDAAVVAMPAAGGDRRLVAYVVGAVLAEDVRTFVAARLPLVMVPSAVVGLAALPLTTSGKLDVRALPVPDEQQTAVARSGLGPTATLVAEVFEDLLGVPVRDRDADFFALGGHSLLAARAVSRLRRAFEVDLRLGDLFAAPTIAGLAALLDGQRRGGDPVDRPTLEAGTPSTEGTAFALSPVQSRLWVLEQLAPGTVAQHMPSAYTITGELDEARLRAAFAAVVERHDSLRTGFADGPDGPLAVLAESAVLPWDYTDARAASDPRAYAVQAAVAAARTPFDLARPPLLRAELIRVADDEHLLSVVVHHLVSDGWSHGLLMREVTEHYRDGALASPPPAVRFVDCAAWQTRQATGSRHDADRHWWAEQLRDFIPLDLPTDRPRPSGTALPAATESTQLSPTSVAVLIAYARRHTATPAMVLLGALSATLARWTRSSSVPVGVVVAARSVPEFEPVVGMFADTLLVQARPRLDQPFPELVDHVRRQLIGAQDHASVSLEQLAGLASAGTRDGTAGALTQVLFTMNEAATWFADVPGLSFTEQVLHPAESAAADLTVSADFTADGGLTLAVDYPQDLYESATIASLLRATATLLEAALTHDDVAVAALPLLDPTAHAAELALASGPPALVDTPQTLQGMFALAAAAYPDRPAVTDSGGTLTFGQVDAYSTVLACRLREAGVVPGSFVPTALSQGRWIPVAALAVLKSGGVLVPVDVDYPPARIEALLNGTGAEVVLCDAEGRRAARSADGTERPHLMSMPAEADLRAGMALPSAGLPGVNGAATDLVHCLFTSGSTGAPKGVLAEQLSLVNIVRAVTEITDIGPGCRFASAASVSFDAGQLEMWVSLTSGAELLYVPGDVRRDAVALHRYLREQAATVSFVSTAVTEQLLAEPWDGTEALRWLLTGGEQLRAHPRPGTKFRLLNVYGPTEAAVFVTCAEVTPGPPGGPLPSLGAPVSGATVVLLDAAGQVVPHGAVGEIYIGGVPLARGYLNRADLTAERFLTVELDGTTTRMYRTGDLARWAGDRLEFLTRVDTQVKVRGYRVEPGEIESVLLDHDSVGGAVVIGEKWADGRTRLVAWVVPAGAVAPGAADALRRSLTGVLPGYMVPARLLLVPSIPLSPNGKLDRLRLAEIATLDDSAVARSTAEPAGEVDDAVRQVMAAYAEVLGAEVTDPSADFFDLGGDSLLAVRLAACLRRGGASLELRDVFTAPTPALLAGRLGGSNATAAG